MAERRRLLASRRGLRHALTVVATAAGLCCRCRYLSYAAIGAWIADVSATRPRVRANPHRTAGGDNRAAAAAVAGQDAGSAAGAGPLCLQGILFVLHTAS